MEDSLASILWRGKTMTGNSGEMEQAASSASATFEEVVRQHLPYLHGLAVRLCGDRERAEDVVQDALLRAFRAFPRLRNRQRPRVWLTRVLRSCFHDDLRKDPPRSQPQGVDGDAPFDLFDTIAEEDPFPHSDRVHLDFLELFDDVRIIEVLQRLGSDCREALILAYIYGFTAREIGEITGAPLGTVLARLSRGRRQLERGLWEYAQQMGLLRETEIES